MDQTVRKIVLIKIRDTYRSLSDWEDYHVLCGVLRLAEALGCIKSNRWTRILCGAAFKIGDKRRG